MEYQAQVIPLKSPGMCTNISSAAKRKDCVLRLLLPKPGNDSNNRQNQSHLLVSPQNLTSVDTALVPAIRFKDLTISKIDDLRKRRPMAININCNPQQFKTSATDMNMLDEDANMLPSKKDSKMSDITIVPVKPKACGCSEPCEIITCEVIVQQYMDQNEVSFMLAMNIAEEEIDSCVMKHCDNKYCDALSIDHDRCRRGLIELYRCDKSNVCDICTATMKGWNSRLYHTQCEKRNEYRHNNVSPERLLKDRFRLRELQILEDSKIRKHNYMDPVNGSALALEAIRNNKELVITPITVPGQKPTLTITAVPSSISTNINRSITVNSQASNSKRTVDEHCNMITRPCSNAASSLNTSPCPKENVAQQTDSIPFSSAQQNTYIMTPSNTVCTAACTTIPSLQSQYICLPNLSSTTVQPTTISNLIVPQPLHVVTNSSIDSKPLLTPIRVMPITNLKTAPSLLHRQQGIPKFCVMAGNVITTLTVPNVQALQPVIAANIVAQNEKVSMAPTNTFKPQAPVQKRRILPQKRIVAKKPNKQFFCVYCCKHFTTEWYFKKHVAKHEKEKHTPRVPIKELGDKHGKKSHVSGKHENVQEELNHDYACDSPHSSIKSSADRTDSELEVHEPRVQKLEFDTDDCDEDIADETNNYTTIDNSNQVEEKKIKYEKMFDSWNENVEIFKNGIKIETQDDVCLENMSLENHDVEELSLNENYNVGRNEFTIMVGNTNRENFEEDVTALR